MKKQHLLFQYLSPPRMRYQLLDREQEVRHRRSILNAWRKLEGISDSVAGGEKSYAIQAGRDVRIMVRPDERSDAQATHIARDIRNRSEGEMGYPGHIKVTVIRETRTVEYAK